MSLSVAMVQPQNGSSWFLRYIIDIMVQHDASWIEKVLEKPRIGMDRLRLPISKPVPPRRCRHEELEMDTDSWMRLELVRFSA